MVRSRVRLLSDGQYISRVRSSPDCATDSSIAHTHTVEREGRNRGGKPDRMSLKYKKEAGLNNLKL